MFEYGGERRTNDLRSMREEGNAFNKEEKIKTRAEISAFLKNLFEEVPMRWPFRCLLSVRQVNKVVSAGKVRIRLNFLPGRFYASDFP